MSARPGVNPRAASERPVLSRYGVRMDSTLNERELRRADEPLSQLEEQLSKLAHQAAGHPSNLQTKNTYGPAVSDEPGNRISLGLWALRGLGGMLLAAGIGVAGVIWLGSPGDAAKTAPSQPAPVVQNASSAVVPSELMPLLQSISRDLTSVGKEIEQLKAGRELMVRDNASLSEQLKASQEQLTRGVAGLAERLHASQEQGARDSANLAEQIRTMRDQLARINAQAAGEQNAPPNIAAAPPRPTPPAAPPARKPAPMPPSPQATAKPKVETPKLSSTTRPLAPAR